MMKKIALLSYLVFALVAVNAQAADSNSEKVDPATKTPAPSVEIHHYPYTAIYQAVYKSFPLQATHRLEPAGNDWYFSSIASGFFGQIEEASTFSFSDKGIVPLHYLYQRNVLGHNNDSELVYNQKDKVAAGKRGNKPFTIKLQGDELDEGSYTLALRDDVARGITNPCYKVIDDNKIGQYCFRITGKETIDTALGQIETIVVERVRKPESPRRTRFWFAPSLDYTIARLEHQEQKGQNAYSLEITYYKRDGSK